MYIYAIMTKSDTQKKAMLEALEKTLGVVTTACKQVGISRETHYRWLREDSAYSDACSDVGNVTLDFAESKLHEAILEGNIAAIIFFLKTKGKVRGYIERQEVAVQNARPDLSSLSDEEIMDAAKQFWTFEEGDFA